MPTLEKIIAIRRIAVRETGVSEHHGEKIEAPLEIPRVSQQHCTEVFKGQLKGLSRTTTSDRCYLSSLETYDLESIKEPHFVPTSPGDVIGEQHVYVS